MMENSNKGQDFYRDTFVRPAGKHQSLYKYISLNTKTSWNYLEDTILNSKMIGSTANSLNDPFELSPCRIDNLHKNVVKNSYSFVKEDGSIFEKGDKFNYEVLDIYRNRANLILDNTVKNSRIVSFSNRIDSPLLWSHYANGHKGACIHFIGEAFFELPIRKGMVGYSMQRPTLPLSLALRLHAGQENSMNNDELFSLRDDLNRSMFFCKPYDWSYEGEYRLVYNIRKDSHIIFDSNGILEIVAGCKMSNEDFDRLNSLMKRAKGKSIHVRRAKISHRTFSVEIEN